MRRRQWRRLGVRRPAPRLLAAKLCTKRSLRAPQPLGCPQGLPGPPARPELGLDLTPRGGAAERGGRRRCRPGSSPGTLVPERSESKTRLLAYLSLLHSYSSEFRNRLRGPATTPWTGSKTDPKGWHPLLSSIFLWPGVRFQARTGPPSRAGGQGRKPQWAGRAGKQSGQRWRVSGPAGIPPSLTRQRLQRVTRCTLGDFRVLGAFAVAFQSCLLRPRHKTSPQQEEQSRLAAVGDSGPSPGQDTQREPP